MVYMLETAKFLSPGLQHLLFARPCGVVDKHRRARDRRIHNPPLVCINDIDLQWD